MKPDFLGQQMQRQRQQQQQMQQQMQQNQQQQRIMGWLKQQENEKRQQEQEAQAANANASGAAGNTGRPPVFQIDPRFARVEDEVQKLRQDFADRKIDEKAFQQKAGALMIQDQQGVWWMVGSQSGTWYRHDGANWVQATPPGKYLAAPTPAANIQSPAAPRGRGSLGRLGASMFMFGLGLVVFGFIALLAGNSINLNALGVPPLLCALPIWLLGLWASFRMARSQWRK